MNELYSGHIKRDYALVGDRITTKHKVDVTSVSESEFLERYQHEGDELAEDLRMMKVLMKDQHPRKAKSYASWQHNFEQTLALTGAQLIQGTSPVDKTGDAIFKTQDADFLT